MIKITFDYDGCLSQPKIQELAKKCISLGCQVFILTSRFDCIRRLKFNDLYIPNSRRSRRKTIKNRFYKPRKEMDSFIRYWSTYSHRR